MKAPSFSSNPLAQLAEALRFLTVLPIPGKAAMDETALVRSMAVFPVAGLVIGVVGAAPGWAAGWLWGEPLRATTVVVAWMLVTFGLHLDGIADTCDALFSWRSRERKLEIMRDSRIGTMGALGLIAIVALKIGGLLTLGPWWWLGALLAPVWGRWADIYGIFWFPAAREGGLGRTFREQVRRSDFAVATVCALVISLVLSLPWGIVALLSVWPVVHLLARRMTASLGGLTGDTYGALSEVGEVVTLLTLAALHNHGLLG